MNIFFFNPRYRFDFSSNTLDIGNPITWKRSHFLKHLFKRIFAIPTERFEEFYSHHLAYFLNQQPSNSEELFFKNLFEIIDRQVNVLNSRDVYAENHVKAEWQLHHLKKFREALIMLDRWNFHKSNDTVVAKQGAEILLLKETIEKLKAELRQATSLDTSQYINISKGSFLSFIDLIIQMQDVILPSGKELAFTEFPIVWVKLICKYFREDHQEIDFNRVRRYFPKDRRNPGVRSSSIPVDDHLFEIKKVKKR